MSSVVPARPYPALPSERDRWILARRGARNRLDPLRPHAFLVEEERSKSGEIVSIATVFLTNRECPWRCLMCDLWKNTLVETSQIGTIPKQIDFALQQLPMAQQIKLYNSGSFFDPRAIPPQDYETIAQRVAAFEHVIVECHPALVGKSALKFRDLLRTTEIRGASPSYREDQGSAGCPRPAGGRRGEDTAPYDQIPTGSRDARPKLEVAMGLETAQPEVLEKLNKRMTLEQFRRAADSLCENNIALRVFVLVKPPFLDEAEALRWAKRSIDFAFDCGASVVSLIPTRFGNGALEALAQVGEFSPPKLATLEDALDYGVGLQRGRVFADLWDMEKFSDCGECFERRRARLRQINLEQVIPPKIVCNRCRDVRGTPDRTSVLR